MSNTNNSIDRKEKIKIKIKSLLAKTTENGATEEEAVSALNKAQKLMQEYFISENDLKDPFIGEKCILKEVEKYKSGYDYGYFYNELSRLFDCEYYFTSKKIYFFGFEPDVELSEYFYHLIIKACNNEVDKYKKSSDYKFYKQFHHGRTLVASFIKGFLIGVAVQMDRMYRERKSTVDYGKGLVVVKKEEKVKNAFEDLNLNISPSKINLKYERAAFASGSEKGKDFEISQGLNSHKTETQKQLS